MNTTQFMLSVECGDQIREVYNIQEAAAFCASRGKWKDAEKTFRSAIKRGFRNGSMIAILPFGFKVKKIRPAKHRSSYFETSRERYARIKRQRYGWYQDMVTGRVYC